MIAIRGLWDEPWCRGVDFNMIRYLCERNRPGGISPRMRRFYEIIDELKLCDLPLQGGIFTWRGGANGSKALRIDRFLFGTDWGDMGGTIIQTILPRTTSDHAPIVLETQAIQKGLSPFKFKNMWLKAVGFKEMMNI